MYVVGKRLWAYMYVKICLINLILKSFYFNDEERDEENTETT